MLNNEELIKKVKLYNKFFDPAILTKAFNFALDAHKHQKRDAGEPYIIHPVAVADILTELKLDSATITTGLLHDTIEDTKATYDSVKEEFGQEIADLVNGVTKISALEEKAVENSKAENLRKLILATSKDILLDCIFLHIEKGVFSLPVITESILFAFSNSASFSDTLLIKSSLLLFIKINLSKINFLASLLSIEKDKSSSSSLILFIPILSARGA